MSTHFAPSPRAYRQSAILTASPGQLVVMAYDGAMRFLHQAAVAMREREVELAHNKLRRAEDIIAHLRSTLDFEQGGEISPRLHSIYVFCERHLNEARLEQDPAKVERVSELLGGLREAWAEIA
jgi:flagellar secretion chaperone FliS